jgi:hypothetical protein
MLEKQKRLEMSQVFPASTHSSLGGFAFQGFRLDDGTPARPPRSFTQVWRSNFKR